MLNRAIYFLLHFFRAKRGGHGVHSPFVFSLCQDVFYNTDEYYAFAHLAKVRETLRNDDTVLEIEDLGAGSQRLAKNKRSISEISKHGISTERTCRMLFRLINFLNARNIIELGTSAGLTTLYLAKARAGGKVCTIEGSASLHAYAKRLAEKEKCENIAFIHASFDDALPRVLSASGPFDLLYIDGNHTYEATMRYFKMALEHKHENSVIVLDDIYWSKGMTRAWKEIRAHPAVTVSIDTFTSGLLFFRTEAREKFGERLYI